MAISLPALRSRNYRYFLAGQGIGLIGTWCQRIAMIWLVYRTTGSPLLLGLAAFAAEIPFLFIAPFGGLIADRVNRRRALMAMQAISSLQAFVLAGLAAAGLASYPVILLLAAVLGTCQAIESPLRQSIYPDLITNPHDLPNAIALMAFMNNSGRLIGPTVAGFLIGVVGEIACFVVNGCGYLVVLAVLWRMRMKPATAPAAGGRVLAELRAGLVYAWATPAIRASLLLLASVSFCGLPYLVLMPVFTREVLHSDAVTLGYLLSMAGVGAVFGLVGLATRVKVAGIPRLLSASAASTGVALLLLSGAASFWLAAVAMACIGFGIVVTATASNILLQSISDDDKRGRVLGFFAMMFFGIAPIGNFCAGSLTEAIGSRPALGVLGAASVLCTLAFERHRRRSASCA